MVVSESFALKYGLATGNDVTLTTISGPRRFPITGVYRDYSNDRGVIAMDRALYTRSYGDDAINTVVIYLKRGVDRDAGNPDMRAEIGAVERRPPARRHTEEGFPEGERILDAGDAHADVMDRRGGRD